MKYISQERLKEIAAILKIGVLEKCLIDSLVAECQEIDTLTVSKLRPMCDAPKNSEWLLGYYKGADAEYFELLRYSPGSGKLRSDGDEFNEDEVLGWLPIPIYKPEE